MPEVKLPLPPDLQYCIDSMTEWGMLDTGSAFVLGLYGERELIDSLLSDGVRYTGHDERKAAKVLTSHAWEIAREMPIPEQGAILGMGLIHRCHDIQGTTKCMAEWAIGDLVEGGYAESHNRPPRSHDGVNPYRRDMRRLMSPAWIRGHIKRDDETKRLRDRTTHHLTCARHVPAEAIVFDVDRWNAIFQAERDRQRTEERRRWNEIHAARAAGIDLDREFLDNVGRTANVRVSLKPKYRRHIKKTQRVAQRAVRLAETVLGERLTRAFVHGEVIAIEGQDVDFWVQKRNHVESIGHGGISVAITDKAHTPLAGLCLYYKDTPAIEQVMALKMEVDAGDERAVLATANITSITPEGARHALLMDRRKPIADGVIDIDAIADGPLEQGPRFSERELREARNVLYWEKTRTVWLEAMRVATFGRAVKLLPPIESMEVLRG